MFLLNKKVIVKVLLCYNGLFKKKVVFFFLLQYFVNNRNFKMLNIINLGICCLVPVSLDEVSNIWSETNAPLHIKKLAEYYGIYKDLFGDAYFTPYTQMDISYECNNSKNIPVYRGNIIKPEEVLMIRIFLINYTFNNIVLIGSEYS